MQAVSCFPDSGKKAFEPIVGGVMNATIFYLLFLMGPGALEGPIGIYRDAAQCNIQGEQVSQVTDRRFVCRPATEGGIRYFSHQCLGDVKLCYEMKGGANVGSTRNWFIPGNRSDVAPLGGSNEQRGGPVEDGSSLPPSER